MNRIDPGGGGGGGGQADAVGLLTVGGRGKAIFKEGDRLRVGIKVTHEDGCGGDTQNPHANGFVVLEQLPTASRWMLNEGLSVNAHYTS